MGAWIAQEGAEGYWLREAGIGGSSVLQQYAEKPCKQRCGFNSGSGSSLRAAKDEEEEKSRRRMVELMLGPCYYLYNNAQQPSHEQQAPLTVDFLNAAPSSSMAPLSSADATPVELEFDSPLPSGWEKCLDLKTGSIYYLNRSMGLNSLADPRRSPLNHGKSVRADLNSWPASPATSEVTTEVPSKSNAKLPSVNMNEKFGGDEGALDLNLSLHVGQSISKFLPRHASVAAKACSSMQPMKFKAPSNVPTASSSSSCITSSPMSSSFPFAHSIMSSKDSKPCPSQDVDSTVARQQDINNVSWHALKESSIENLDHLLFGNGSGNAVTYGVSEDGAHASIAPMVTVACSNCLMFVMLSSSNPKCPRCGTCPDHLDFLQPPLKRAKLVGFSF